MDITCGSNMYIDIETDDNQLIYDLFKKAIKDDKEISKGESIELNGVIIKYNGIQKKRNLDIPTTFQLIVTFVSGSASGLFANWLYDKIYGKANTLSIDKKIIEIDKGEIKRIIETHIEK